MNRDATVAKDLQLSIRIMSMHNARKQVESEGRLYEEKFLTKNSKSILEVVSQVSSYEKERERESYLFSPFQYTFKSVIATSIEIDLGEVPSVATKVYIFPLRESCIFTSCL